MEYFVHLGADSVDAIKQACGTEVEELNVTENGTYNAPSGKAYNPVTVNVESSGEEDNPFETASVTVIYAPKDGDLTLVSISCMALLITDAKHIDFDGYIPEDMVTLGKVFEEVPPTIEISLSDGDNLPDDILNKGLIMSMTLHLSDNTTSVVNLARVGLTGNITYDNNALVVSGDGTITVS